MKQFYATRIRPWLTWLTQFFLTRIVPWPEWSWWRVAAVAGILWICGAAVLPVLVGVVLVGWTDQARDIVIADASWSWKSLPTLLAIPIAVTIWALIAWYWARVTVQYALINPPPPLPHQSWHALLTVQTPRLIGTAAMLSVALAFWQAHKLYSAAGDDHRASHFLGFMCLYFVVAGIFYIAVSNRDRMAQWLMRKGLVGTDET